MVGTCVAQGVMTSRGREDCIGTEERVAPRKL